MVKELAEVIALFRDGDSILVSGFYDFGRPDTLLHALHERGIKDLALTINDPVTPDKGPNLLIAAGQVRRLALSFLGTNPKVVDRVKELADAGRMAVEFIPQGTLIERIRAGGYGLGGFFTRTGAGTEAAKGKESRVIDGKEYVLEKPLRAKYALVKAWKADTLGNLHFRGIERNFNIAVARAADITIAEAEVIQKAPLDPEEVHVPHCFVDYVVQAAVCAEGIWPQHAEELDEAAGRIAARAAMELRDGDVVNLGVGIPTQVVGFLPKGIRVWVQSENGILGMGPPPKRREDIDHGLIDAGRHYVSVQAGGSVFDSADSFGMIRGGHVDVTILGALQVDQEGNLASWSIPGRLGPGMGGAMDLAAGAKRLIVTMRHTLKGAPKILRRCTYPLTAVRAASLIITEMAVLEVRPGKPLLVRELAQGVTQEQLTAVTEAKLDFSSARPWGLSGK